MTSSLPLVPLPSSLGVGKIIGGKKLVLKMNSMFSKLMMDCVKINLMLSKLMMDCLTGDFPKENSPNSIVGTIVNPPCVSLEIFFSCFQLCTPHFDHDYDGHNHCHCLSPTVTFIITKNQDHHDHLGNHDHDYLCKADSTAVVSVKRNSELVVVPQGVRRALGLKHP